jgi:hypothetical protein
MANALLKLTPCPFFVNEFRTIPGRIEKKCFNKPKFRPINHSWPLGCGAEFRVRARNLATINRRRCCRAGPCRFCGRHLAIAATKPDVEFRKDKTPCVAISMGYLEIVFLSWRNRYAGDFNWHSQTRTTLQPHLRSLLETSLSRF